MFSSHGRCINAVVQRWALATTRNRPIPGLCLARFPLPNKFASFFKVRGYGFKSFKNEPWLSIADFDINTATIERTSGGFALM